MAKNFERTMLHHPREPAKEVVLIGRCKKCKTPFRSVAETGLAEFEAGDPAPFQTQGKRYPAFQTQNGLILQAYSLVYAAGAIYRCKCGFGYVVGLVQGRFNDKIKCDGRCMGATGPNCECSCGGRNHGSNHQGA